ncbi:MAG TPA: DUF1566 domain-containing protein [Thermoanaerobaculia bacterium]|nr:DUF1566 domain-containing protein [Thermoanaerobaculia bacterium]
MKNSTSLMVVLLMTATLGFAQTAGELEKSDRSQELIELPAAMEMAEPEPEANEKGYWIDEQMNLVWTVKDNGYDIDRDQAGEYCDQLSLGGYEGWRLPSIDQLAGLYDPESDKDEKTRGPVEVTGMVWSGSIGETSMEAWLFGFDDGRRDTRLRDDSDGSRALCVNFPER